MLRRNLGTMLVASLALMLLSAGAAHAQFGRGGGGPGGFGGRQAGGLAMTGNEAVQKDLGLSAEAIEKLAKLRESIQTETRAEMEKLTGGGGFQALQDLSAEQRQEMQKKMQEANQKLQEKIQPQVKEILTAEQQTRLQQIGWQVAGVGALGDPALAKELAISDDQKKQIAAANEEATAKQRELFQGAGGNFQELGPKMQELNKARDEKIAGVLTADQKAAFEKAKGKPFDVSQLRGGFGGGRGGAGKPGAGKPGTGRPGRPALEGKPETPPKP